MATKRSRKLKVEDVQEQQQESKPLMSFPEACVLVTTTALVIGIAAILYMNHLRFG